MPGTETRAKTPVDVDAVRAFNRFYTRRLGLLDERHLKSDLTLAEVRVLYELAHGALDSPGKLARSLGLDAGYVSRLVMSLERRGMVSRAASGVDARRSVLALTAVGRKTIARLEKTTREHLTTLLADVPLDRRDRLVGSMRAIEDALTPAVDAAGTVVLREPRPGDLGWVLHRQAVLYAEEYGWDWTYEGLVAGILGRFVADFQPAFERCWIAERAGAVVGSVFIVRKSVRVAQLRLLYVEPSARGAGIGRQLVDACIAFARAKGYRRLTLWTNDVLVSARRIYVAAGFTLSKEERHRSFGKDLVGQNWDLDLR